MTKKILKLRNSEQGQVVLIILLIMAVLLTIGLSVISRSVTDIKISQQSQEAARTLWVAQAGLEKALKINTGSITGSLNNINYVVTKSNFGAVTEFVFPEKAEAGKSVTLWLVGHNETTGDIDTDTFYDGNLTLYWGDQGESSTSETTPAIEATLIYQSGANFYTKRYVYDPYPGRSMPTHFTNTSGLIAGYSVAGKTFAFSSSEIDISSLPPNSKPFLLQLRLIFNKNEKPIAVKAGSSLPGQGNCYQSAATVSESGITRKLEQCHLWDVSPNIFDFLLFSGGGIT